MTQLVRRLTCLLLLIIARTAAAAPSAGDWQAGKEAFERADYESALLFFQSAKNRGIAGPAVHYNIGVSHFKLGDYDQAREEFELIAERYPQLQGLAEYNLGLIARRTEHQVAARRHFLRAYELSTDDQKLRALSSRMLRELAPSSTDTPKWVGAFALRAGYDDNVALRDEQILEPGASGDSPMVDVFGSIRGPMTGRSGIRLDASAYAIQYSDADDFNQMQLRGGVIYDWGGTGWRWQLGGHLGYGTLGGDGFEEKAIASARLIRYLGRSAYLDFRLAHDEIREADAAFVGIAGSRQRFGAHYNWFANAHRILLGYRFETNERDDPGISPQRHEGSLQYRYQPVAGWGCEFGADLRTSEYDDLEPVRTEDLLTLRAALTRSLPAQWLALLEVRYYDNDASDELFSYERTQVTLSALKTF